MWLSSQDGKRLYLAYGSTLEVIDTSTGAIIGSVNAPDRVFDTFDDLVFSHGALGGWRFVVRAPGEGPWNGEDAYGVAVFDTNANKFLPDAVSLPRCDNPFAGAFLGRPSVIHHMWEYERNPHREVRQ